MKNLLFRSFWILVIIPMVYQCNPPKRLSSVMPWPKMDSITKVENIRTISTPGANAGPIELQYLGCGGVMLRADSTAILVDPFFSNPCLFDVFMGTFYRAIRSDSLRIQEGLARIEKTMSGSLQQTKAIFVSHSHYDHLMDVPAIMQTIKKRPVVYLNQSGTMTCAGVIPENQRSVLGLPPNPVEIPTRRGSFTVYPIPAAHNPHVFGIKFFAHSRKKPLSHFSDPYQKTRSWPWREGQTYGFLIDYKDHSGKIIVRLYIQSSSCNPETANLPAADLLNQHPIDVALLGVASYHFSPDYPDSLLQRLQPENIAWIHWENFFGSRQGEPHTVRQTNVEKFLKTYRTKFRNQFLPLPGAGFRLIPSSTSP